jgi:hypothetical protein
MDHDDLLARIQRDGRLYGPNESRRVMLAVLGSLSELLPAPAYRRLLAALPADVRQRLPRPGAGRISPVTGVRVFVARIAGRLHVDGPDAAFLARVVLTQLNASGRGCAPAALAPLVPADLRPLLRSGAPETTVTRRSTAGSVSKCHRLPGTVRRSRRSIT